MASSSDRFLCLACGADYGRAPYCKECGAPTLITADLLPTLIRRKLNAIGFEEIPGPLEDPSVEQAAAGSTGEKKQSPLLLTFPPRFFERRATPVLYVAAIAMMEAGTDCPVLLTAVPDFLRKLLKRSAKRIPETIHIRVYILCSSGVACQRTGTSELTKSWGEVTLDETRSMQEVKTSWRITLVLIDTSKGIASNANRYVRSDAQVLGAIAQLTLPKPPKRQPFVKLYLLKLVEKPIELVRSYCEHLSLLPEPEVLAFRIPTMAPDEVIKTLVMGITITVLANQVFRVPGEHWTNISMVNSLLDSLLVSVSALVSAAFAFPVLRIAGGHGSFRNTFVGAALIAAVLSPSFALIQGAAAAFHLSMAHNSWQPAALAFVISAMIYAPIHDLPWRRAMIALFSPFLLLFLLLVFYLRA